MTATYDQIIQKAIQARQAKNRQQALAFFKEAMIVEPGNFYAYREAGVECRELGLFSEAESFFQMALEYRPHELATVIHRAIANRRQGNHGLCLQQLMEVADQNSKSGHLCDEIGLSLQELGRLEEAGQWFRRAMAEKPADLHVLGHYGSLARMMGDRELALAQFETMIQYHPLQAKAYLEAATELQALGRYYDAVRKLQLAFIRIQDNVLLEKYLLMLFEQDAQAAVHELFLHAAYYPVSDILIQRLSSHALNTPQDTLDLNTLPKPLLAALLGHEHFAIRAMQIRTSGHLNSFLALLAYFEAVLVSFTAQAHRPLINDKLFLLLIMFSWYKKNSVASGYVIDHAGQFIPQLSFSDLCRITLSLKGITSDSVVLSLFAKAAIDGHSVDCLLACLIMLTYYPDEPCLAPFADKESLLKLLPPVCVANNTAVLKNIFTHLLQKEVLAIDEVKAVYSEPQFIESLRDIEKTLKPVFQPNRPRFDKPEKLRVALCISGQLRGYKEAFVSIKKALVDPLRPDIFVHTWQDVGFKEPFPNKQASSRVFQGHFLDAYLNLSFVNNFSFPQIKEMLPTVFTLLNKNATATQEQLKAFYQTDFVVVENDQINPYEKLSNQQKMFYKIDACNQLVKQSGKPYDLVIRLRPDKELFPLANTDWFSIAEICNTKKMVYVSSIHGLGSFYESGAYHVGDLVAIGSQNTMNFYANVSNLQPFYINQGLAHFDQGQHSQSLLGHGLWLGGYTKKIMPLEFGDFLNTSLRAEDILSAVKQDSVNLGKEVADSLINALERDILDQRNLELLSI